MKVPYANFKTRTGDTDEVGGCTFIGGEWKDIDTTELFDNKKIVLFAFRVPSHPLVVHNNCQDMRKCTMNSKHKA